MNPSETSLDQAPLNCANGIGNLKLTNCSFPCDDRFPTANSIVLSCILMLSQSYLVELES